MREKGVVWPVSRRVVTSDFLESFLLEHRLDTCDFNLNVMYVGFEILCCNIKKRGNCVLAPILNSNCDFALNFFHFAFLPLLFGNETSVYPYSVSNT